MREYEYVTREEYGPVKTKLTELINTVQNELREYLTFSFKFVGSSSRNMITREINGNRGYDFDADLRVNQPEEYTPSELKHLLINAFNHFTPLYGFGFCEDSSSVITIKTTSIWLGQIITSCDFAIVRDVVGKDGKIHHLYVYFDKENNEYYWRERTKEYTGLKEKEAMIKQAGLWDEVRDRYLRKKCLYSDEKKSRTLYAETLNEISQKILKKKAAKHFV